MKKKALIQKKSLKHLKHLFNCSLHWKGKKRFVNWLVVGILIYIYICTHTYTYICMYIFYQSCWAREGLLIWNLQTGSWWEAQPQQLHHQFSYSGNLSPTSRHLRLSSIAFKKKKKKKQKTSSSFFKIFCCVLFFASVKSFFFLKNNIRCAAFYFIYFFLF